MRIKKHKNGNEYLQTKEGYWIRNFTKSANPIDINSLTNPSDYFTLIENQLKNESNHSLMAIDIEMKYCPKIIIVSDGYQFKEKQSLLKTLPEDVLILGVNRSLAKWNLNNRPMNFYVVNNPFSQCLSFLPTEHRYYPSCITSIRTFPDFIKKYKGEKFKYYPAYEENFSFISKANYNFDDYRNPICAAIGLAFRFRAIKLLLFCCDDVFGEERPSAEQLPNGFWMYPQHRISHSLIEGNLHWFKNQPDKIIKIANFSNGPEYNNISTIKEEKELKEFFVNYNE